MEIALVILSTVLFGGQFIALDAYQKANGKTFRSVLFFLLCFSLTGALIFLSLNAFQLSFSWYTFVFALIAACIQIALQFFGIKALAKGRVEIYTLFNVSGGMSVAYLFGISYFHEEIKVLHIIGLILIILCLLIPVFFEKKDGKKNSWIFWILCILVFLSNGFFGSVNKIHIVSGEGLSIKEYMFYMYILMSVISLLSLLVSSLFKKNNNIKEVINWKPALFAVGYGLLNGFGMFLQYMNADKIPASILFPLSNGGCIVFSLIFACIFYKRKPRLIDIIQMLVALGGMSLFFF